jgi:4-hydroxy-3-polyprenylbenzoate decarboxylase
MDKSIPNASTPQRELDLRKGATALVKLLEIGQCMILVSGTNSFCHHSDIGITGERETAMKKEFVVGVTGASGAIYAKRLLEVLCRDARVHIIVSDVARKIANYEGVSFEGFGGIYHENDKLFASIASGSHRYDGMVVIPCSSKTLAAIANGFADNLITRTADVCLKEHRTCILVTREMPLSKVHLKNMLAADEAGATIMPASPGFYNQPEKIDDLVDMVVARVLDHLGVEHTLGQRWSGYDA